jgi:hypothetical protein
MADTKDHDGFGRDAVTNHIGPYDHQFAVAIGYAIAVMKLTKAFGRGDEARRQPLRGQRFHCGDVGLDSL